MHDCNSVQLSSFHCTAMSYRTVLCRNSVCGASGVKGIQQCVCSMIPPLRLASTGVHIGGPSRLIELLLQLWAHSSRVVCSFLSFTFNTWEEINLRTVQLT